LAGAGTVGGGIAGFIGGLVYGLAGASQPLAPGMGAVSVLLVLFCLTILVALIGGVGVAFGIAAAGRMTGRDCPIAGGALVVALGGHMMGGSLDLLSHQFPDSRLRLDRIGAWFGEAGFGRTAQLVTAALEGGLFAAG